MTYIRVKAGGARLATGAGKVQKLWTDPDFHILNHGDSISRDWPAANQNYLQVLRQRAIDDRGLKCVTTQRGINGQSWDYQWDMAYDTLTVDAPTAIDAARIDGIPNRLILFAGTNGIALKGNSAAQELAEFEPYIEARIAAGWDMAEEVFVCTMLPRGSESVRSDYNSGLVSRATTYGYNIVRLDLNANIGVEGATANTTYFYDGLHPTVLGQSIISDEIWSVMFP